jgi:hypothetical protein
VPLDLELIDIDQSQLGASDGLADDQAQLRSFPIISSAISAEVGRDDLNLRSTQK